MIKKKEPLSKAKQKHFEILRKNNVITDSKNGELSLTALKLQDIILLKYQEIKNSKIVIELAYLRKKLHLEQNNDYVIRIKNALKELQLPIEVRDFTDIKTGKEISWLLTAFVQDVEVKKETQHLAHIQLSEKLINYLIDKAGYTEIIMQHTIMCKTKYSYKIYEMYLRYYGIPNKIDKKVGFVKKGIDELNNKFGTNYKNPSDILKGIKRGLDEIKKDFNIEIFCYYDKDNKVFVFSWEKTLITKESKCIIPFTRIDETINWIMKHNKQEIKDETKYEKKIKGLILNNDFEGLEESYRGMLVYKYGMNKEAINSLKTESGKYKDFAGKEEV